jgi:hypothetical protein
VSERRDAIVRLLRTRDERLPLPVVRSEASSGFVHRASVQLACEDCLANGKVMKSCETCGGRGHVLELRERDPYATDKVLPYGFSVDRHELARERDRQLDRLEQQLKRPGSAEDELAEANEHPYAWETARKRMYRDFDYAALDLALELLRATDVVAYHALHAVFVYGYMGERDAPAGLLERGLAFLDERLPEPLRAPGPPPAVRVRGPLRATAGTAAKSARDEEMRARAVGGASPDELAREFEVSVSTVYRVVNAA